MGLPDIIIEFSKKAVTAIQNGSTGIVGIMLKDAKNKGAMVLRSVDEIPTGDSAFSAENTAYIERAFIGSPSKVIIYTMDTTAESYDEATKYFATQKVNYIVGAPDLTTEEATKLATWVKGIRKNSVTPVLAYAGLTAQDLTTWSKVGELIAGAISNPYVLSLVVVSVWNTLNDPTTKGLGDSARAKSYTAPQ